MRSRTLWFAALTLLLCCLAIYSFGQDTPKRWVLVPTGKRITVEQVYAHSYALLIGINKYANAPENNLNYAVKDVADIKQELITHYGFPEKNITVLTDEKATRQGISDTLNAFTDTHKIQPEDRVLIYFSGHGQTMKLPNGGQMGFLIPSDARIDLSDTTNLEPYNSSCLRMRDLWETLSGCPARHVLLIADACYSGLLGSARGGKDINPAILQAWQSQRARMALTAGGQGEEAQEDPSWGHGAFTKALLDKLRLRAVEPGQVFTTSELFGDLQREVVDLTAGKQRPHLFIHDEEGEFLFVTAGTRKLPDPMPINTLAHLAVTSEPKGATVLVDKKPVGTTPYTGDIDLGLDDTKTVEVAVTLDGYAPMRFKTQLQIGNETQLPVITLKRIIAPVIQTDPKQMDPKQPDPKLPDAKQPEPKQSNTTDPKQSGSNPIDTKQIGSKPKIENEINKVGPTLHHDATLPHEAQEGDTWVNPKDGAEMVYIAGGPFQMGGNSFQIDSIGNKIASNGPVHQVAMDGYWIYKTPVTVGMYKKYCNELGADMPPAPPSNPGWKHEDHPMVNVDWFNAQAYCQWAGLALPSEAQWEKAARGKLEGKRYPWGDIFDRNRLWCSNFNPGDSKGTKPVRSYPPNGYGLYDMAGNVWQWCSDGYDPNFYNTAQAKKSNPENQIDDSERVLRGGSWRELWNFTDYFRCDYRNHDVPNSSGGPDDNKNYGFRCASPLH